MTNQIFESTLDTTDAWIRERTGIIERRHGGTTVELGFAAASAALRRADVSPESVDLLLLATTTPDEQIPASSAVLQHRLGLRCGALDLNAACSGFVYGLVTAYGLLEAGLSSVLLVGSETLTRFTDPDDRSTAILMADGAGAVLLVRDDEEGLLGFDLGCDGAARDLLHAGIGSTMTMLGSQVFKRAIRASVDSSLLALERAKLAVDDVDLFIPHQANQRIMTAVTQRLGIRSDRLVSTVERTGNTSAASIPIALDAALEDGRVGPGDIILLSGFGAGMTWGSAVLRWR